MDILQDIIASMRRVPENRAFVISDEPCTYGHLGELAAGIKHITDQVPEGTIGIVATDRIETYAAILAILASGKTYVMLHPAYPAERNLKIAQLAGMKTVLCAEAFNAEGFEAAGLRLVDIGNLPVEAHAELTSVAVPDTTPAYILFTSGSTGVPKGVPISRRNLNAFYTGYHALGWKLDGNDRMLQMFELTFDVSIVSTLYPLTLGAVVYTVGNHEMKHFRVFNLLESEEITFAAVTPSLLQLLSPYFSEIHLPALKYLILTAEASPVELIDRFRACVPNAVIVNLYGPTEATIYCTAYRIPVHEGCKHHNGMLAIGKPFLGIGCLIVNEEEKELAPNRMGELLVTGDQVMQGYLNDPEKTASVLVPRSDGKIYYRTGDLCMVDDDGCLIYCGRKDHQVKIQGFRIELSEVEQAAKSFFDKPCHVVAIPIMHNGICTELQLAVEIHACDEGRLLNYLQRRLPPYMVPKQVCCIPLFPTTVSNKTDRKKITEIMKNVKR